MKRCGKCLVEKPLEEFGRNRPRPDGRSVYCKPCAIQYFRRRPKVVAFEEMV